MKRFGNVLLIFIRCTAQGLAYALFLIPHHFVPGGVSGIAIILNYFAGLPVGLLTMVFNVPIFLLGLKTMGRTYVLHSFGGMVASSLLIDFFNKILKLGLSLIFGLLTVVNFAHGALYMWVAYVALLCMG